MTQTFNQIINSTNFHELFSLQGLVVLLAAFVVDIAWGYYIRRSATGKAVAAANGAVFIMLFGAIGGVSLNRNAAFLLPVIIGNWCGTYFVIKKDHKKTGHE